MDILLIGQGLGGVNKRKYKIILPGNKLTETNWTVDTFLPEGWSLRTTKSTHHIYLHSLWNIICTNNSNSLYVSDKFSIQRNISLKKLGGQERLDFALTKSRRAE